MSARVPLLLLLLLAAGAALALPRAAIADGEGGAGKSGEPPVRFRRVYAPADRVKDWPRDSQRYIPTDPAEFERLVGLATGRDATGGPGSLVATAEYRARMTGEAVFEGEATLTIVRSEAGPGRLFLDPCNLALAAATWLGETREPARWSAGPEGKLEIEGDRTGPLALTWSLRGHRDASRSVDFAFDLPPCPVACLHLELPQDLRPLVEGAKAVQEGAAPGDRSVWRIELGGRTRFRLRLVPAQDLDASRKLDGVRQATVYDVSPRGVEISAQWTIDVRNVPLRQIAIELDPGVELTWARYGQTPLAWSSAAATREGEKRLTTLELPESLRGTGRTIRLGALARVEIGRRWRLPEIRPRGLFWQEGTVRLVVPAPLVVEELAASGGRQTATGPLAAPRVGEAVDLQCFAPQAGIEVVLARPQAPLDLNCGTTVELSGVEMTGQMVADARVSEGEQFQITAEVAPRWTIDSVESVPAQALDDWTQATATGGPLTIRLAKAVLPERPIRLVIGGHYLHAPLGRTLAADELEPLRFHARPGKRLLCVRAAEPYRLKLSGAERLARLDPQALPPADAELFLEPPRGLLFTRGRGDAGFRAVLEMQRPSYSAALRVEATASAGTLTETYWLRCVPEAARVDRLLVRFSQGRATPLQWALVGEETEPLAVKPSPLPAFKRAQGEAWEVALRRPRSVPFEIRATRATPLAGPQAISLVSLPEATTQRGALVVGSAGTPVRVKAGTLTSIPLEPPPADRYGTSRAAFAYDPVRDAATPREPALTIAPAERSETPPAAWVWSLDLESRYEPGGSAHHLAVLRIENMGREQIALTLPASVSREDVQSVWLDGARAAWTADEGDGGRGVLHVALPAGRRFPVVSVRCTVAGPTLRFWTSVAPPLVEADLPILARGWTVWLPPGYQAAALETARGPRRRAARTISQRLFGPLGRGNEIEQGGLLEPSSWRWGLSDSAEPESSRSVLDEFLQRLSKAEASLQQPAPSEVEGAPSRPPVSWGDLLAKAAEGLETQLLVDRRGLARAAVTPRTAVTSAPAHAPTARGVALLEQADLALLVDAEALLLTSTLDAAAYRSGAGASAAPGSWCAMPPPLARQVREAAESGADPCFVPADVWRRLPAEQRLPWAVVDLAGHGPTDAIGWAAYRLDLPTEETTRLTVVHHDAVAVAGWIALVAACALVGWRAGKRPAAGVLVSGLLGVAALWTPDACGPLFSGAFLGALAGLGWAAFRRAAAPTEACGRAEHRPGPVAAPVRVGALVGAVMLAAASGPGRAGEPAPAAAPDSRPVYSVFIPVDGQEKPTGEKYFVPEDLYRELQRRRETAGAPPQPWRLTAALYQGALAWQTAPEQLVVSELKAVYDFQVAGRPVRVRIPLGEGTKLAPGGALLEGRTVTSLATEGSGAFEFEVPEPGPCRLELPLRPSVQAGGGQGGFEIRIPPLATARMELAVPRDAPGVEVPTACGAVVRDVQTSRLVAHLGPCDRLAVRWPEGTGRVSGQPAVDLEELLWLKIKPGAVVLDAVLKCRPIQGRPRRLELAADPRLRLASLEGERSWLAQVETVPGSPQTVRFELARVAADPFTVQASFLLAESAGVGRLRLPRLDPLGARVSRRWLAVSVDPALTQGQEGAERLQAIAAPVFLSAWGDAKTEPLCVYNLPSAEPDWSISTAPAAARTTAEQTLAVGLGERGAEVRLDALLTTDPGLRFQYRILAPAELEIERISVLAEMGEQVARWSRRQDGSILVFLVGPATGKQPLVLRGRLPEAGSRTFALPLLRVEADETKEFLLQLSREPTVEVEVNKVTGLAESDAPPADESATPAGRPVKCFRASGTEPPGVTLTLKPNRPEIRAVQTTSLRSDGRTWEAEADFRVTVSGGLADEFRLRLPANWTGPFQVSPAAPSKVADAPGAGLRELVIRPRSAVRGEYRLKVSGPLALAADERPSVPGIVLQGAETAPHLVVLPVQSQLQPLAWETRGMVRVDLPDDYPVLPAAREALVAYQVVREPFRTVLSSLGQPSGAPQVLLADAALAWQSDGACRGAAAFDLDPAGLAECPLVLPADFRLVQVAVDGVPATPLAEGVNSWKVPLPLATLPQRIEVVFEGALERNGDDGLRHFPLPMLGDLPVRMTLWTIAGPPGWTMEAAGGMTPIERLDQEMRRLRNLTEIAELAGDFPEEEPASAARWHGPWARRWVASRDEAQRLLAACEESAAQPVRTELETLRRRQEQAAQRLKTGAALSQASAAEPIAADPWEICLQSLDRPEEAARGEVDGMLRSVSLVCRPEPGHDSGPWLPSLGLIALAAVVAWGAGRPRIRSLVSRWPQVLGVVAGAAWWLWLWPGAAGAAVAILCGLWLIRAGRRARVSPRPGRA